MDENRVHTGVRKRVRTPRRAELRTLLRSRAVQAVLLATFGVQIVAVANGDGEKKHQTSIAESVSASVSPRLVRVDSASSAESASSPAEAEAARLAAAYRAKGFNVPDSLAAEIAEAAEANEIDLEMAFGLVATESEFKATALSPVGAIGLAQLMPATARLLRPGTTKSDLRQPEINLSLGFRFLRDLLVKYEGDTELALLAYNRGPGTVDRILERGGDPDNGYADKVLGRD